MDILFSVAGSAIWFAIGAIAAWGLKVFLQLKRRGHVRRFIGGSAQVHIVLSNVSPVRLEPYPNGVSDLMTEQVGEREVEPSAEGGADGAAEGEADDVMDHATFMRAQPDNILWSPTAEGAAVARLYLALHEAAKWKLRRHDFRVDLSTAQTFSPLDSRDPFVCIGGPSVNHVSKQLLSECVPQFRIQYPTHEVHIGDTVWREPGQRDGRLLEDYGFILCGKTALGAPFVVVWGTYALGTLVAARAFLDNWKKFDSAERKKFKRKEGLFLVVHGRVLRFQVVDPIQPVRPQPQLVVTDVV
ncbi:hypothetical protein AB0M31_04290 [Streptomyces sp. NPDC051773]|uniref:hypothetical protein n=1 Tax=Streptomyces sp. NPDC051773 TaxID=3156682 RepID=UPI003418ACB3